jgi:hypothetical protein
VQIYTLLQAGASVQKDGQNGLTITKITIPIISNVGPSLMIR